MKKNKDYFKKSGDKKNENINDKKFDKKFDKKNDKKFYKKDEKYEEKSDDGLVRLNKYVANSGVCSRRQADALIEKGLIKVNGKVSTELGQKIKPSDKVEYKGKVLKGEKNVYYVMNKPKDYITTLNDPQGRKTVMRLFKGTVKERIYPVGRLDRNTTGVLLFTNDGDLTKKLTHPSKNVPKVYLVTLDKPVIKKDVIQIVDGLELDDGFINADAAYYYSDNHPEKVVIEIHSGRNRIVRRIFEKLNYDVKNLDRTKFSNITKKDLKRGSWRKLTEKE